MFKKISILSLLLLVGVSCNSTKSVKSSKSTKVKSKTETTSRTPKTINVKSPKTTIKNDSGKSTETLESTSTTLVYAEVVKKYIETHSETAKTNMKNHGIPASITLAQGILESGAGQGHLAKTANNHFGIKCHKEWTGDTVNHDDDEAQECFRKYAHASESFKDHSLFLTSRSRYNSLFSLDKGDYVAWAKGLKAAGYATDPKYPDKLIGLIERYELHKYDEEVLGKKISKSVEVVDSKPNKQINVIDSKPSTISTNVTSSTEGHTVVQGDTLYSISRKYNVTVDQLKQWNNLSENTITIGQVLKVK